MGRRGTWDSAASSSQIQLQSSLAPFEKRHQKLRVASTVPTCCHFLCPQKFFFGKSTQKKNLSTFDFECQHFSCEIPRHFLAIPEMSFFSHCHTFHSGHVATHSAVNRFPTFQPRNSRPVSNREIKDKPGPATRGGKKR